MTSVRICADSGLPNTCVQGLAQFRNIIFTKFILLIYIKPVPERGDETRLGRFSNENWMYNLQSVCKVAFELKMGINNVTNEICLFPTFHWFKIKMAFHQ
jgi:hypothetical protein